LHGKAAWNISKRLAFLYFVASNYQLHKNHFENFLFFYTKGMKMIEPPARDSKWEEKSEWKLLRVLAGSFSSLYYSKNGDLDTAMSSIMSLEEIMKSLETEEKFHMLLSKLYSAVGLLLYHKQDFKKAESYMQRTVNLKKQYLTREADKFDGEIGMRDIKRKNRDRELFLIFVYFIYKIAKINQIMKRHDVALTHVKNAESQIKFLSKKFACTLMQIEYFQRKFKKIQEKIKQDIKQEASNDLKQMINKKDPKLEARMKDVGLSLLTQLSAPILARPESDKQSFENFSDNFFESEGFKRKAEPVRPQTSTKRGEEISTEKLLFRIRQSKGREGSAGDSRRVKNSTTTAVPKLSKNKLPEPSPSLRAALNEEKKKMIDSLKEKHDFLMKNTYKSNQTKKAMKVINGSQFALVKNKNEEIPKIYEMTKRPVTPSSLATRKGLPKREPERDPMDSLSSIGLDNSEGVEYIPV
jgi:tetratricopeptide (TPR) repeat protein